MKMIKTANRPFQRRQLMTTTRTLLLLAGACAASCASAAVLFTGSTDTVYKSTSDNANTTLTNTAGAISLTTSSSWAIDQSAAVFGNFNATELKAGDSITLSFTATLPSGTGNNRFYMSLTGDRGVGVHTSDFSFTGLERSYAGFHVQQYVGASTINFRAIGGGQLPGNTGTGSDLLYGLAALSMGSAATSGTNPGRFDGGDTADFVFTVTRSETQWTINYSINVAGSGIQASTSTAFTPSGNYFGLTDDFTTFAIGLRSTMDASTTLSISNLQVTTTVPEPSTMALLAGLVCLGWVLRRRRMRA